MACSPASPPLFLEGVTHQGRYCWLVITFICSIKNIMAYPPSIIDHLTEVQLCLRALQLSSLPLPTGHPTLGVGQRDDSLIKGHWRSSGGCHQVSPLSVIQGWWYICKFLVWWGLKNCHPGQCLIPAANSSDQVCWLVPSVECHGNRNRKCLIVMVISLAAGWGARAGILNVRQSCKESQRWWQHLIIEWFTIHTYSWFQSDEYQWHKPWQCTITMATYLCAKKMEWLEQWNWETYGVTKGQHITLSLDEAR